MNDEERSELLRQVAECAPKEMGAQVVYGIAGPGIMFGGISVDMDTSPFLYFGKSELGLSDINNATAIIAMLDAMENAPSMLGVVVVESHRCTPSEPYGCKCVLSGKDDIRGVGSTRAEAVARAFVQVFGVKP